MHSHVTVVPMSARLGCISLPPSVSLQAAPNRHLLCRAPQHGGPAPVEHGGISLAGPCLAGQAAHLTVVHSNEQVSALRHFSHGCLLGSADTQCGQCLLQNASYKMKREHTGCNCG